MVAASSLLIAYTQAREEGVREVCSQQRGGVVWKPPDVGVLKINVDGAIFKEVGVGLGVVIRDHEGSVMRAACKQVSQLWDVDVTEAKVILPRSVPQ